MPPGHPIILLKSNEFNMAALSVKRSIVALILQPYKGKNDTLFKDGDPQKPPTLSPIAKDVSRNILSGVERVETFVFANCYIHHHYRSIHMFLIIFTITIVTF